MHEEIVERVLEENRHEAEVSNLLPETPESDEDGDQQPLSDS